MISIHAPLTGSDPPGGAPLVEIKNFNPRSPYGERRYICSLSLLMLIISIHAPLTGSDILRIGCNGACRDFNPRSPYGERPPGSTSPVGGKRFQSTLPLRGATQKIADIDVSAKISIHAPLTGSDT